ncbi:TolC family protein [candidate division KSB1 bacterium]
MKKSHLQLVFIFAVMLFIKGTLYPQENYNKTTLPQNISALSLNEIISYALENNPKITAAESRWKASLNQPGIVSGLPDPTIGFTYFNEEISTRNGSIKGGVSIAQKFPWFGKLSAKSKIKETDAEIFSEALKAVKLEVIANVKKVYYDLYWIWQAVSITERNIDLLKQFESVSRAMYASGQVPQQDVLKAQVELSKLYNDHETYVEMRKTFEVKLNGLLGKAPFEATGNPEEIEFKPVEINIDSLYAVFRKNSPHLKMRMKMIKKADGEFNLSKLENYPDFSIGYNYQWIADDAPLSSDAGKNAQSVMISMNIPLWFGKNRARVNDAEMKAVSQEFNYKDFENMRLADIKNAHFGLINAERKIKLYRDNIIPRLQQALNVTLESYKVGKSGFLDLIDSQKLLLQFQLEYEKSISSYFKKAAELEFLTGAELNFQ